MHYRDTCWKQALLTGHTENGNTSQASSTNLDYLLQRFFNQAIPVLCINIDTLLYVQKLTLKAYFITVHQVQHFQTQLYTNITKTNKKGENDVTQNKNKL